MKNIPERLQWAVEELSLRGDEAILEIGCGRGVAVSLVCPLLRGGTITGIDRSATAIDASRERNREHVGAGKAFFHQASIEAFEGRARAFHIAFAVNVNLFWLDAAKGLDSVRRLLADDGRLFLFYEAPSLNQRTKIAAQLAERLAANGYRIAAKHEAGNGRTQLLGVTALPAARA